MAEMKEALGTSAPVHEELAQLRARAAELEAKLKGEGAPAYSAVQEAAKAAVAERWTPPVSARHGAAPISEHPDAIQLNLAPEKHDEKMGELIGILQERGVSAAIAAAEQTGDPHLIDDFERVLIEYVHEGLPVKKMPSRKSSLGKSLGLSLLEVTLPQEGSEKEHTSQPDPLKEMRDFIAKMEQFYRSMLSLGSDNYFSFEIANGAGQTSTSIYIAVPASRRELFEKQLAGLYPEARIIEHPDDYNIFAEAGVVAASQARLAERPILSLRTFEDIPSDPMDGMLAALSRLDKTSEGAAVQFVLAPSNQKLQQKFREALQKIRQGKPIWKAIKVHGGFLRIFDEVADAVRSRKDETDADKRPASDDPRIKAIERKIASPLLYANIRVVASAPSYERAEAIRNNIEASFEQVADASSGSRLQFSAVPGRSLKRLVYEFSYRFFDERKSIPLSAGEVATLAHVPRTESAGAAPELRQERSSVAPAPADLPQEGTLLGVNRFRGGETKAYILPEDRLRHLYIVGQTGTGKSVLLKNIILQDIRSGAGVCFIDPHGSDVLEVLSAIPPERAGDVIYFDPGSVERPMALNMLEYDPAHPEHKTLVVDELFGIFKKLFGAVPESMGPAFEQYFRNAALLVMESPESGGTLLDIARIFSDDEFRAMKLGYCKNPIITRFWQEIAMKTSGDQSLANYAPYVTNKFDIFTTNEIMRPIIAQQKSSFNFRDLMDNRKILLVNLAKGKVGDVNANLLGLIIVGKFLLAALSRTDSMGKDLAPFYLHIDEFQNFTTPSIATILSEARKYKLSLTVAHQFIAQLDEEIRDAVFGNVGSLVSFRVGADDAEFLEKQFQPQFTRADLMRVDNYSAFIRLLSRGRPVRPFNIATLPFIAGSLQTMEQLRDASFMQYGRPRAEIEQEIADSLAVA